MKKISALLLGLFGWKIIPNIPPGLKKAVIIAAPHTSNWDFIIGRLSFYAMGIPVRFLIKKESFFWPLGPVLKSLGAIPVDRKNKSSQMILKLSSYIHRQDSVFIVITPEGTRSRVKRWKRGFYTLAKQAKIPILISYIDYSLKTGGIGPIIEPGENEASDMMKIKDFYKDIKGRFPENFNPDAIA